MLLLPTEFQKWPFETDFDQFHRVHCHLLLERGRLLSFYIFPFFSAFVFCSIPPVIILHDFKFGGSPGVKASLASDCLWLCIFFFIPLFSLFSFIFLLFLGVDFVGNPPRNQHAGFPGDHRRTEP